MMGVVSSALFNPATIATLENLNQEGAASLLVRDGLQNVGIVNETNKEKPRHSLDRQQVSDGALYRLIATILLQGRSVLLEDAVTWESRKDCDSDNQLNHQSYFESSCSGVGLWQSVGRFFSICCSIVQG